MQHQKAFGQPGFWLPEEVHEEHFQQDLQRGFEKNKRGVCTVCFMKRTSTGTCNCDEPTQDQPVKIKKQRTHDEWLEAE
jgi:hypothetical protein